jgi:putative endonuclease
MPLFSRLMFALVRFGARRGIASDDRRRTGIRGETFAYWYLRRHGYVFIARNYTVRGVKGEIDLVGYDGSVLAFVEVKTRIRAADDSGQLGKPEDAVTHDKRRNLVRMARQFLAERRLREAPCRFDVLAIESRPGRAPEVRLHKGAFAADG